MPVQSWVSKGGMTVPVKTSVTEAASQQIGDKHIKAGSGGRWRRGTVEEKGEAPLRGWYFYSSRANSWASTWLLASPAGEEAPARRQTHILMCSSPQLGPRRERERQGPVWMRH